MRTSPDPVKRMGENNSSLRSGTQRATTVLPSLWIVRSGSAPPSLAASMLCRCTQARSLGLRASATKPAFLTGGAFRPIPSRPRTPSELPLARQIRRSPRSREPYGAGNGYDSFSRNHQFSTIHRQRGNSCAVDATTSAVGALIDHFGHESTVCLDDESPPSAGEHRIPDTRYVQPLHVELDHRIGSPPQSSLRSESRGYSLLSIGYPLYVRAGPLMCRAS